MRIIRYFANSITIRLAMLSLVLLAVLLTAAQVMTQRAYRDALHDRLIEMESRNQHMQAESLSAMLEPYLDCLYAAATDPHLVDMICHYATQAAPKDALLIRSSFKEAIINIRYIQNMGVIFSGGSHLTYEKHDRFSSLWQTGYLPQRRDMYQAAQEGKTPVSLSAGGLAYVAVPAVSGAYSRQDSQGCVVAGYDLSFLAKRFQEDDSRSARHFLADAQGYILACADLALVGRSIEQLAAENPDITVMSQPINTVGWTLYLLVDREALLSDLSGISGSITLVYLLIALVLVGFSLAAVHLALSPMRKLSAAMEEAGQGNLSARVPVEGRYELWQIVAGYNRMMDRLEGYYKTNMRYYQRLLDVERRKNQAEMAMLESHINAHFLFNTLNAINYQALEAGNRQVSLSIKHLANIMRYAFNSRMKNVRLYQEAAWVEQYLQMQKERLGESMSYDVSIDDDVADWPFRKMMLQPFVENAIIHGIDGRWNSVVLVRAHRQEDGRLMVAISDNGRGMDPAAAERIRHILVSPSQPHSGGIGLSNVAERIYAFFGPTAEILLETTPQVGTCFTLLLPMPTGEELKYGYLEEDEEEDDEIY